VAISTLDRNDPVRRRFGALHGASMLLLLLQTIAAAAVVAAREKREDETMSLRKKVEQADPSGGGP
jgi:hypothetical protein